jgi:hypothetical protein
MDIYLIECRTGCTCCSYENHHRGPYFTKEEAERRITFFLKPGESNNPVASQYARKGHYSIKFFHAEEIPNNRIIIDDTVFAKPEYIIVDSEGKTNKDDIFCGEDI